MNRIWKQKGLNIHVTINALLMNAIENLKNMQSQVWRCVEKVFEKVR